jgi:hypothetical protein
VLLVVVLVKRAGDMREVIDPVGLFVLLEYKRLVGECLLGQSLLGQNLLGQSTYAVFVIIYRSYTSLL